MRYIFLVIFTIFSGCTTKLPPIKHNPDKQAKPTNLHVETKTKQNTKLDDLYAVYKEWKGTNYKYGGLSLSGVDCSGFVLNIYKKVYNIKLPRTTSDQVKLGRIVYLYELKTGDLLFFKTGWNVRHVGIYLENGKFMHASSNKGVTISSINEPYWKGNYWQTRRLI